jgi:hypothetical protein
MAVVTGNAVSAFGAEGHLFVGSSGANRAGARGVGGRGGCDERGHQNQNEGLSHAGLLTGSNF